MIESSVLIKSASFGGAFLITRFTKERLFVSCD